VSTCGNGVADPGELCLEPLAEWSAVGVVEEVELGDVDDDGAVDLVASLSDVGAVAVAWGAAGGSFAAPQAYPALGGATSLALGPAGAGLDVWVAGAGGGEVGWLTSSGPGMLGGYATLHVFAGPVSAVAAGDVTGDGPTDLVVALHEDDQLAWFEADGMGAWSPPTTSTVGDGPVALALGDLDGDVALDVVAVQEYAGGIAVLLGGPMGLGPAELTATAAIPSGAVIASLTGTAASDVAVSHFVGSALQVLPGDGAGGIGAPAPLTVGSAPMAVIAADVDGDAVLDLVTANEYSNDLSVCLGDGNGGFAAAVAIPVGTGPVDVAAADVDGVPGAELAVAVRGEERIVVLRLGT
jgi:hypothetical protein